MKELGQDVFEELDEDVFEDISFEDLEKRRKKFEEIEEINEKAKVFKGPRVIKVEPSFKFAEVPKSDSDWYKNMRKENDGK